MFGPSQRPCEPAIVPQTHTEGASVSIEFSDIQREDIEKGIYFEMGSRERPLSLVHKVRGP